MDNWKRIWSKKETNLKPLLYGSTEDIFMGLKRSNGFDVMENALSFPVFCQQSEEILKNLGGGISSVFEVGCGSGANLYLYEQQGIQTGGIDYSANLIETAKKVLKTKDLEIGRASCRERV